MTRAFVGILRIVPDMVRGDCWNVGVVVHAWDAFDERWFCRTHPHPEWVTRLWPDADGEFAALIVEALRESLAAPDTEDMGADPERALELLAERVGNYVQIVNVCERRIVGSLEASLDHWYELFVGGAPDAD